MKKLYAILIMSVFLSLFTTELKAQIVKLEGFAGLNLSQIDGDQAYGYDRIGLHAGIGAIVPVYQKGNFDIEIAIEAAFNQRGSHQAQQFVETENGITGEYDIYMSYLETPLMIYFTDKQITSFGIGMSIGKLSYLKEYEHGKETDINISYQGEDKYNLYDFCILAELKFRIHEKLKMGLRYQYSMLPIRERDYNLVNGEPDIEWQNVKQYNNVITARLIYVFNEDRSQYIYDEYKFTGDNPKIQQKAIDKKLNKLRKEREKAEKKSEKSLND